MYQHPECLRYLPIEKEWEKLPKQFLTNIVFTCIGTPFAKWVKERISERNSKIVEKQNLAIDMDPDILAAFMNSNAVSSKCPILCQRWLPFLTLLVLRCSQQRYWRQPPQGGDQEAKDPAGDLGPERRGEIEGGVHPTEGDPG